MLPLPGPLREVPACLEAHYASSFTGSELAVIPSDGLRGFQQGVPEMCDFSLHSVRSRSAKVGDRLVTHNFGTGTRGFAAVSDSELAVCLMPGTELAFAEEIAILPHGLLGWRKKTFGHRT